VSERLREVAEVALCYGVIFLCEQADVVAEADQPVEKRLCVFWPILEGIVVNKPEAAS
jgi:hypothetical protein